MPSDTPTPAKPWYQPVLDHWPLALGAGGLGVGGYLLYQHLAERERRRKRQEELAAMETGDELKEGADKEPPGYRPADTGGPSCGTCRSFTGAATSCSRYGAQVSVDAVCDGFKQATLDLPRVPEPHAGGVIDSEAAFKAGFALRCTEEGLTADQIDRRADRATKYLKAVKSGETAPVAYLKAAAGEAAAGPWDLVKWLYGPLKPLLELPGEVSKQLTENLITEPMAEGLEMYKRIGQGAILGGPALAGAGLGFGLGKLQNFHDRADADLVKRKNLVAVYRHHADQAKRKADLEQMQGAGDLVPLS